MHLRTLIALTFLLPACEEKTPGRKLASGIAQRIAVSDRAVAFLTDARRPEDRAVPEDLLAGDLQLARLEGEGAARRVGAGVATTPDAFAFSRDGEELAFLARWRFREGTGELWVATAGGEPQRLAEEVSAFAWSPKGASLAFVAPGKLGLRRGGAVSFIALDGLHDVAWAPAGDRIAARAGASAGGRLWLVDPAKAGRKEVAAGTTDFAFGPDGTLASLGPPPPKGGDRPLLLLEGSAAKELGRATAFAFSPDGKEVALFSTAKQPGEATGELSRVPRAGGASQTLGKRVSDWRWAGPAELAFLANYDLRARAGALTVARRGEAPREVAPRAQSLLVEGGRLFWLVPVSQKGDFKIELWTSSLAGDVPRKIDEGVYGWQMAPDGKTLFYKARCAGGPRSCSLLRLDLGGGTPKFLAANVAGFDLSRDGTRLLLQQPHRGATRAVDLAVIAAAGEPPREVKPFVFEADTGSRFADAAGKSVVVATIAAGKGGVFLVPLP